MGELHGCNLVALAYEIKHGVIRRLYCAIDLVHVRDQRTSECISRAHLGDRGIEKVDRLCTHYLTTFYHMHDTDSWKFWQGIKFDSLVVYFCNCRIKICQYFILAYIRLVIPYRTEHRTQISDHRTDFAEKRDDTCLRFDTQLAFLC